MPPFAKPSSRASKKQVAAYLAVDLADDVRRTAKRKGLTIQQFLANAINDELQKMGLARILTSHMQHMFVRANLAAKARLDEKTPDCRRGTKVIAGWYERPEVNALIALIGTESVQDLAERALLAAIADDEPPPETQEAA